MSSAAVVIGALRVKRIPLRKEIYLYGISTRMFLASKVLCCEFNHPLASAALLV